jgi:hypothetical protein
MSSNLKQIESFTYQNVRYFLPDAPPAVADPATPWSEARSLAMLHLQEPRPTKTEYVPSPEASVEYVS